MNINYINDDMVYTEEEQDMISRIVRKHKIWKYLPALISAFFISVTVLNANLGEMDPQRLVSQTRVTLVCCFAAVLYHTVMIIWNRMKDR